MTDHHKNHLQTEKSPYLQQHVNNPVDWYPWSAEALAKAKAENKPILLSIGYSACHWCHVMAHESFEDIDTAILMNQHYINIKVDREERPDLDKIYQLAHQLLFGRGGGWPLTMFLNPNDQTPFFGGTYFPKIPRPGLVSFKEVLLQVRRFYQEHEIDINSQGAQLSLALSKVLNVMLDPDLILNSNPIDRARHDLALDYDPIYGGFGDAPKFPVVSNLRFLLNYSQHHLDDSESRNMLDHSLKQMAISGIFDQIGGGFFRYSVDEQWMIPHFEKMLYDNAELLGIYIDAYRVQKNSLYYCILTSTCDWLLREMHDTNGGFYSSLDADSEGIEGKYYYWDREQLRAIFSDDGYHLIIKFFGLDHPPNVEHHHWHLHCRQDFETTIKEFGITADIADALLTSATEKMLKVREQRIRPHRDEKILTAWNARTLKALAKCGYTLQRDDYLDAAFRGLDFIEKNLWKDEKLYAVFKDGEAYNQAYLDDYAFLLDAVLDMLQFRFRVQDFEFALQLGHALMREFRDEIHGGFFFTAHDHEVLFTRTKAFLDEAIPSGNGIAALALLRLGHLLADIPMIDAATDTLKLAWPTLNEHAAYHTTLLLALADTLNGIEIIIIRGDNKDMHEWQSLCLDGYHPARLAYAIPNNVVLPSTLQNYAADAKNTVAYLCKGMQCSAPITSLNELKKELKHHEK